MNRVRELRSHVWSAGCTCAIDAPSCLPRRLLIARRLPLDDLYDILQRRRIVLAQLLPRT